MRLGDIERWLWWIKTIFIFCFVNAWPGIGLNVTMTKDRFEWCTVCFKTILHVPIKVMHAKSMLEYARMKGFKFFKENIFCFCNRLKFTWRGNGWKNVYLLEKMHVKSPQNMECQNDACQDIPQDGMYLRKVYVKARHKIQWMIYVKTSQKKWFQSIPQDWMSEWFV